jgi:hypothetical protein
VGGMAYFGKEKRLGFVSFGEVEGVMQRLTQWIGYEQMAVLEIY